MDPFQNSHKLWRDEWEARFVSCPTFFGIAYMLGHAVENSWIILR